jgi:hypothetical protein
MKIVSHYRRTAGWVYDQRRLTQPRLDNRGINLFGGIMRSCSRSRAITVKLVKAGEGGGLMKETIHETRLDPGDGHIRDDASLLFGRINAIHN